MQTASLWNNGALLRFALAHFIALCIFGTGETLGISPLWGFGAMVIIVAAYASRDLSGVVTFGHLFDLRGADKFFDDDPFWYFLIRIILAVPFFFMMCALMAFQLAARSVEAETRRDNEETQRILDIGPPRSGSGVTPARRSRILEIPLEDDDTATGE